MTNMEYAKINGLINQNVIKKKIHNLCYALFCAGICVALHLILHKYHAEIPGFIIIFLRALQFGCAGLCGMAALGAVGESGKSAKKKLDELRKNKEVTAEYALLKLGMVPED